MKPMYSLLLAGLSVLALSCNPKDDGPKYDAPLQNPTKVTLEQVPFSDVVNVTWQDNSDKEAGYAVFIKQGAKTDQIATLAADTQQYTISEGLKQGNTYSVGIQAISDGTLISSQVIYKEIALFDYSALPVPELKDNVVKTPTSLCFEYVLRNSTNYPRTNWGLCWSEEGMPTKEDHYSAGPLDNTVPVVHALTCAQMDYGKTYKVRAYIDTDYGTTYSETVLEVSLGEEPEAIVLNWKELTDRGLPEDIKLYETTDNLNGDIFHAWYAIADVTKGNVEFRMAFYDKAKTMQEFYKEVGESGDENYIMTNAGYFNMSTGETGDFHVSQGIVSPAVAAASSLKGTFGVDKDQKPNVLWTGKSTDEITYFYQVPMANISGKNKYDDLSPVCPDNAVEWNPYYAMAAGPLLVKDGKVMIDVTMENGTCVRNYENVWTDIFGATVSPDRTAVGYTEDGKIILFICDGRIKSSQGATILETAQLMKGLGCVGACNFDGGGSTAMLVKGDRINSYESNMSGGYENRSVGSVMGFYKKQ